MSAFANLASGGSAVAWQTSGGISFQRFDANFHAVGPVGTFAASAGAWLSVAPLGNGGFSLIWDSNAASTPAAQDFDANGAAVGSTYAVAVPPTAQNAAFTTRDQPSTVVLADGSYVVATSPSNTSVHIQHYDAAGNPAGPEFVDNMPAAGYSATQITPISDGGYLVIYRTSTSSVSETIIHRFHPDGTWQSTSSPASYSGPGAPTLANQAIAALPEGGFVIVWTAVDSTGAHVHRMEFDGVGAALVADQVLGDVAGNAAPTIDVFPTGRYEISWTSPAGAQHSSFTRASGAVTPGTNDLIKVGLTSYTLPVGPHNMLLVGTSAQTVTGNSQDNVITANEYASTLNGGGGNDTLIASHNGVILNGGSGADKFVYPYIPWGAGHVTDFTVGTDRLDFSALFQASGYNGTDPIADGYLQFASDGSGGTRVYYDPDGPGAANPWPTLISTLDHVSPNGLTAATVLGGGGSPASPPPPTPPPPPPPSGQTFTANDSPGQTLTGGSGDDTFYAGHSSVVMTGSGGADKFVFQYLPWSVGHITDFVLGTDRLDLSTLFQASGYTGSNPVADGYLQFISDGAGGTKVLYDTDGPGSANPWPYAITYLDHVLPNGLTAANVLNPSSSPPPPPPPPSPPPPLPGQTFTANDSPGQTLTGGSGDDTFYAGHSSVVMTGNGSADKFVFQYLPWSAGHITDFTPGTDKLDLHVLFQASHYSGSNPIADGYLQFQSDGQGGTKVYFDPDGQPSGSPWPFLVTTLDHVAPATLHTGDWMV